MNDAVTEHPNEGSRASGSTTPGRPIIFGEVLWDHFPDGRKILGGAPFNVAWNLKGLGFDPFFVSAVGDDETGRKVCERMDSWGLDRAGLQTIEDRPTGVVSVQIENNQPSYEIVRDQAYDFIAPLDAADLGKRFRMLYHGSLVFRSERSRATLRELIRGTKLPRFVDVNIRQPHFDRDWLPDLIGGASWVKLNHDELADLSGRSIEGDEAIVSAVAVMRERFGPATYFVTCGARGAYAIEGEERWFAAAPEPLSFSDSVGAGDAFAAATIGGLLRTNPPHETLKAASKFASRICGITGGTTHDRAVYQEDLP